MSKVIQCDFCKEIFEKYNGECIELYKKDCSKGVLGIDKHICPTCYEKFIEGKNELYKLENGYTIHPKDLKMVKSKDYSVEVTHIPTGITVKCRSTNSILKNKNKCLEVLEEELIKKTLT
ncbi:peptide chain release factor 1 [Clostridioides difficile]|uniref:peptide chain release factor family protein n=1 Tax=Clostridioides difficile TaxID=1496 RepID=UPI00098006E4|nr:peptide chain release factor-like protein [Clostridioides difficile]SJW04251.1 peptide chain release factor 1 [Clostridioides difficile]